MTETLIVWLGGSVPRESTPVMTMVLIIPVTVVVIRTDTVKGEGNIPNAPMIATVKVMTTRRVDIERNEKAKRKRRNTVANMTGRNPLHRANVDTDLMMPLIKVANFCCHCISKCTSAHCQSFVFAMFRRDRHPDGSIQYIHSVYVKTSR